MLKYAANLSAAWVASPSEFEATNVRLQRKKSNCYRNRGHVPPVLAGGGLVSFTFSLPLLSYAPCDRRLPPIAKESRKEGPRLSETSSLTRSMIQVAPNTLFCAFVSLPRIVGSRGEPPH